MKNALIVLLLFAASFLHAQSYLGIRGDATPSLGFSYQRHSFYSPTVVHGFAAYSFDGASVGFNLGYRTTRIESEIDFIPKIGAFASYQGTFSQENVFNTGNYSVYGGVGACILIETYPVFFSFDGGYFSGLRNSIKIFSFTVGFRLTKRKACEDR